MSSLRNKNKERFRTIIRESFDESPNHSRPNYPLHSPPAQTQPTCSRQVQEPSAQIIKNLEKHINFIQKKLMENESQKENLEHSNQVLRQQLYQKEALIGSQLLQIKSNKQALQDVLLKYESLKVDVDNYKLQQKIDRLNSQINQDKEVQNQKELQFARKKDRFSSAFLPSPFGSPKNYSKQSSQIFDGIMKDETCQSSYYRKDPFEQSLWSEWNKLKKQKVKREKDMARQVNQIEELQKELLMQRRQFQKVKLQFHTCQQKYIMQILKLKAKINSYAKDKQLSNSKSMVEEKTMEISQLIKSSAASLPHILQKTNYNLEINSSTICLTIQGNKKQEKSIQTNEIIQDQNHSKIEMLSTQIKEMQLQMTKKQKQWKHIFQQSQNSYKSELKDASDMMDLYKCRIEHLSKIASDRQTQKQHPKRVQQTSTHKMTREIGVSCSNNPENMYQQLSETHQEINQLKEQLDQKRQLIQTLSTQLELKNTQLAVEREQLNSLRSTINKLQNQIAVSENKIGPDL